MNNKISVRSCKNYDLHEVGERIAEIYEKTDGPDVNGMTVIVKPNILSDTDPARCVSTHPVVLEAMIRFLQSQGATLITGDSPSVHRKGLRPEKSGIFGVCERTGAGWVDFMIDPVEKKIGGMHG